MVVEWLACLTDMREVSQLNLASYVCWITHVGKWSAAMEVGSCHVRLCQVQIKLPTLALKPRGDVTRSQKQEYQCLHKKGLMSSKKF